MKITDAIQEFILYKQSLGMSYRSRAFKLNAFARFTGPIEIDSISPEAVRRFQSLPLAQPKSPRQCRPYVYSVEEVQKMIRVVDNRHRGQWHLEPYTIRTLILLLYGTGLRIGEAIRLQHQDVYLNAAILTVRKTSCNDPPAEPEAFPVAGPSKGPDRNRSKVKITSSMPNGDSRSGALG